MRIVAVFYVDKRTKSYIHKSELNFVSYFNRSSVRELLCEFALSASESLDQDPERKIFEHKDFLLCCHLIGDFVSVIVTDLEYPSRVIFELLRRIHADPSEVHLDTILNQCQDPYAVDALMRTQQQLEETLVIMHENVNKILQRGDDIDKLVEKSERLSIQSKAFYKVARSHNRCCVLQ